jgi:hypothetical protein
VQNSLNVLTDTDHFIPHWPQPGLLPRQRDRGAQIETLCYKGSENNLYHAFRSNEFRARLAELGLTLQYDVKENVAGASAVNWFDYRNCDLVLAVRDITEEDAKIKPATKLINAWLAGCPALLGPEPAFQAMRRSPLDYFEVRTPQEALDAATRLKQTPGLFDEMVENGLRRGAKFIPDRIAEQWRAVLGGPIAADYCAWNSQHPMVRLPKRWVSFALNTFRHKRSAKAAEYHREHGYRPISGRNT